jgi:flagellin
VSASYLSSGAGTPYPASTTLGSLIPGFTDGTIKGQGPGPGSIAIGFSSGDAGSTLTDLASYIAAVAGTGGSASYDDQTGLFSVTVGAGRNLTESGTNGILTALGLHALDNSAGASAVTMTSTLSSSASGALDISTASHAATALTSIKSAITQLASDRADIGANISVLSKSADQLGTLKDNLSTANSRLADIDVAEESTQFARYNILVQAGTAMLSQANSSPQSVLRLLG